MAVSAEYQRILSDGKVTTRKIDLNAEVRRAWGPEWGKDEVVYQFGNGKRKFLSTDRRSSGIYDGT